MERSRFQEIPSGDHYPKKRRKPTIESCSDEKIDLTQKGIKNERTTYAEQAFLGGTIGGEEKKFAPSPNQHQMRDR